MRQLQYREDEKRGEGKRSRTELAPEYVRQYTEQVLEQGELAGGQRHLGAGHGHPALRRVVSWVGSKQAALLCVERDPEACHRSLIAERFHQEVGFEIKHLKPVDD